MYRIIKKKQTKKIFKNQFELNSEKCIVHVGAENLYQIISNFTLAVIQVKHSRIAINIKGKKLGLGCNFDISDSIELCIVELTRVACIKNKQNYACRCNSVHYLTSTYTKKHTGHGGNPRTCFKPPD